MSDFSRIGDTIRRAALPTITLLAVAAIVYGAWLIHPAAGLIVGGSLVLADVVFMMWLPGRKNDDS